LLVNHTALGTSLNRRMYTMLSSNYIVFPSLKSCTIPALITTRYPRDLNRLISRTLLSPFACVVQHTTDIMWQTP